MVDNKSADVQFDSHGSRRDFIKGSAAAVATTAALAGTWGVTAHAAGGDLLRVGLVGTGGRGTGAAQQALAADSNTKLVAMADAFQDRLDMSLRIMKRSDVAAQVDVAKDRQFTGVDGYKKLIEQVDVVLLATPPHFRPMQLEEAVRQGKHVFVEKPVGVDTPGVLRVQKACEEAKKKGLAVLSGLCYRYELKKREIVKRIHDGQIGQIIGARTNYVTSGLWHRGENAAWSQMETQLRNWLYYTWLSGDHILEQHIHSYDKIAWVFGDKYPDAALGIGARMVRTEPKYGNIYDSFCTSYEYPNGVVVHAACRQQNGCDNDVSDVIYGTKGMAFIQADSPYITGENAWKYEKPKKRGFVDDMYQNEHNEFFASIRAGKPMNNGEYMCNSTFMGLMGRASAYTGKRIKWEQVLASTEDLSPKSYELGDHPVAPVAKPGVTKFA